MAIRPMMILPPVIFAGLAAMFLVGMYRDNPDELPSAFIGQDAPGFPSEHLPGFAPPEIVTGEVTLVNFWASWCPPCRAEHPRLMQMASDGLNLSSVNFKDDADAAVAFLTELGDPFTKGVGFDPLGRSAIDWGVTAPPETFIISKSGTVLYRHIGPLVGAAYEKRFLPELQKALASE